MGYYQVKEDEQLLTIFLRERGRIDVEAVTGDANNAALFETRSDLVLRAGDALWLPDEPPTLRVETLATGQLHRFQIKGRTRPFHIVLKNPDGTPVADTPYELVIAGHVFSGVTTGDGSVNTRVPSEATDAQLRVGGSWQPLRLGGLDPLHTIKGIKGRLYNLGYAPGAIDGNADASTSSAIAAFQGDRGLDVTGVLDDGTRDEIKKAYGF